MERIPHRCRSLAGLLLIAGVHGSASAAPPGKPVPELVVYRCTDANGAMSLRDTPCARGQQQQARDMLRPQDPPPRPLMAAPPPAIQAGTAPAPQVIVLQAPQPMYECTAPDGERYTNDTGLGRHRWEGVWLQAPNYAPGPRRYRPGQPRPGDADWREDHDDVLHPRGIELGPRRHRPAWGWPHGPIASGSWVRDPCQPLPPAEACDRLRDRRYQLDRRYNSALQSERAQITLDQRGIDARLANDCRGY